jgi:CBS domain-containing protein
MKVGELCTREVVIIEKNASVLEAAKLMRTFHVGDVVVVEPHPDDRIPVGILTDRDIVVELIAGGVDLQSVTVGDVISYELITALEDDDVIETVKRMRSKGVRRIPVVNSRGGLEGILSLDDLLDLLAEQLNDIVSLIKREQKEEEEKCV